MRKEPATAKGQETLDRVRAASRKAIAGFGRDAFTTSDVAELAGVSIGTVYSFYEDRVDILDDLWPDRPQEIPWA